MNKISINTGKQAMNGWKVESNLPARRATGRGAGRAAI
jgi:hypothetical protein